MNQLTQPSELGNNKKLFVVSQRVGRKKEESMKEVGSEVGES